jgi:hypothetical protein
MEIALFLGVVFLLGKAVNAIFDSGCYFWHEFVGLGFIVLMWIIFVGLLGLMAYSLGQALAKFLGLC